jgi:hypothetical protein
VERQVLQELQVQVEHQVLQELVGLVVCQVDEPSI